LEDRLNTSPHRSPARIPLSLLLALLIAFSLFCAPIASAQTTTAQPQSNSQPSQSTSQPKSHTAAKKKGAKTPEPEPVAQPEQTQPPAPPPPPPTDALGRTSPYGCVIGFLRAAEANDWVRATQFLDGKRSQEEAETLAKELKYLLDRGLSTSIDKLSREPAGNVEENQRQTRDLVGTITTPAGDLNVYLDQVKYGAKEPTIWLFSQVTLYKLPAAYNSVHHTDYTDKFPAWAQRIQLFGVPIWRWGTVLITIVVIFLLASLVTRIVLWLLKKAFHRHFSVNVENAVLALKNPFFFLIIAILQTTFGGYAITALSRHYWKSFGQVLIWLASGWLLIQITDILTGFYRQRLLLQMRVERATFVSLIGRLFKILVALIVIIGLLKRAGVDISAVITGLGIGGVAIAFAAQKSLADLFGGISIILRGAVRVGDFCQIDGIFGTVEDIGISSLSLRTLQRSLVSIPNSKVAEVKLENLQMRDQFWISQTFTLRFDTPHEVLKIVLDNIYQLMKDTPGVDQQSARARLINLTPNGPQIEIFAYYRKPGTDYASFLAAQEPLLLKILGTIEAAGTNIATPMPLLRLDAEKLHDQQAPEQPATTSRR
jgi:MscS family membrane protein